MNKPGLQYLKENVPIVKVVEALGYTYNRRKGKHPLQYEHPDGDKVIISNKVHPAYQVYFTRHNYTDHGTVVDFVKNRLSMFGVPYTSDWDGVFKVLASFSDGVYPTTNQPARVPKEVKDEPFNPQKFHVRKPDLDELSYLRRDRSLNEETLKAFLPHINIIREKRGKYENIGFPYKIPGKETISGFEVVNHGFKGHATGSRKRESVWLALMGKGPITDLYIAESVIDAMSFYQLFRHRYSFNHAAFISTGGYVVKNQVENLFRAYPNAKVHTLFDNDFSGRMYDILVAVLKAGKSIGIKKKNDSVEFETPKGTMELSAESLSLSKFERMTGIRTNVRTHKADGKDFNEMLQQQAKSEKGYTRKR